MPTSATVAQRRSWDIASQMLNRVESGRIDVVLPDGSQRSFGPGDDRNAVELTIRSWAFFPQLVHGGSVGVGASYMAGSWHTDDLVGLIRLVIANRDAVAHLTPRAVLSIINDRAFHLLRGNRVGQATRNIRAHYDLSNELYQLFLDETMTYSAAYFERADQSLADAQRAKYHRLAESARIDGDSHVLEIGCGWGGFAEYAVKTFGCRVTGITLSERQADFAKERMQRAGIASHVDIQICDYRHVVGTFDRVISIEMLEAVGHRHLPAYFATIDRVLAPDGLVAIQVITIPEQRYRNYRRRPDFIQRYIFPGGHLPSLHALTGSVGKASTLFIDRVDNIAMHYAATLRQWRQRFMANLDEVRALGFDDRFIRMWEFYLAYCEAAFRSRYIGDLQLLLTRTMNATLPAAPYEPAGT